MPRKFYTIDDLYEFCKSNNFTKFSSKESGAPLVIQSIETFESVDNSTDGLLDVKLKSCHIGVNRNKSSISEDTMNKYKNSFKGRPILGSIFKADTGEWEFGSHDMELTEDGDIKYIEQPIGVISQIKEPYLEYDKDNNKTYLMVEGHIFEDYSHAADILERRKTCKCSVEISVDDMSYNTEEDYLSIDAFTFRGVTVLGFAQDGVTEILEGMEGSKITIEDFSEKNNSMFSADYQTKLIETLENLNNTLSTLTINSIQNKEVFSNMNHFEELLQKYEVTAEECDFDHTNMTDEELDAKFEEVFGCKKKKKCDADESEKEEIIEVEESTEDIDESEAEEDYAGCKKKKKCDAEGSEIEEDIDEDYAGCKKKKKCDADDGECEGECEEQYALINFKISHDDIRFGIQSLLNEMNGETHYYVVNSVYDNYFYYEDWYDGKAFKQDYKMRKDNISFNGDPVPVFREFVTQAEKDELENMRKNYAILKEFKEQYDAAQLQAEKDVILSDTCYDEIRASEEFKELVSKSVEFGAVEIRTKADLIYAAAMKKKFNFSNNAEAKHSVKANINAKPAKKTYAGLFDD